MKLGRSLNVFFTVDRNFIIHFTVTLTSLLENNKDLAVAVYVIHDLDDISIFNNVISFFNYKYSVKLNLVAIDKKIFNDLSISNDLYYVTKAAYYRLLLADIIPSNVTSGLYVDCDTIVTGSLKELVSLNFFDKENNEEYSLLAVADERGENDIIRLSNLGILTQMYFNSGVMFLNLKKWRLDNASRELMKTAGEYKNHLKWVDQDVLNIYFKHKCGRLSAGYNKFSAKKSSEMPLIIHFSGAIKPWHYYNNDPYKYLYWKYLNLTPFKNQIFEKVTLKKVIIKHKEMLKKYLINHHLFIF